MPPDHPPLSGPRCLIVYWARMMYWAAVQQFSHIFLFNPQRNTAEIGIMSSILKLSWRRPSGELGVQATPGSAPGIGPSSGLSPARFDLSPSSPTALLDPFYLATISWSHSSCVFCQNALISLIYSIILVQHSRRRIPLEEETLSILLPFLGLCQFPCSSQSH